MWVFRPLQINSRSNSRRSPWGTHILLNVPLHNSRHLGKLNGLQFRRIIIECCVRRFDGSMPAHLAYEKPFETMDYPLNKVEGVEHGR